MMRMLLSVVVSLVPMRYRKRWFHDCDVDLHRGAVLSSILQFVGSGVLLAAGYPVYLIHRESMLERMAHAVTEAQQLQVAYNSVTHGTFFEYLLLPSTMLLMYIAMEGTVRMVGAIATQEVIPTLPLAIADWVHGRIAKRHHEHKQGPRIVDEIIPGTSEEYDLRIDSCREKKWTNLTTVNYQDQLYEVARQITGPKPRPWVYLLKKMPGNKIVRGIHHYSPEEVLVGEEQL
jgi:hypothetical protein